MQGSARTLAIIATWLTMVTSVACGSSHSVAPSSDGGVAPRDTGSRTDVSLGDGSGPCNTIVPMGPPIQVSEVQLNPPAPSAGSIANGTYVLTSVTLYADMGQLPEEDGGVAGIEAPTPIVVNGDTWQWSGAEESTGVPLTYSASISGMAISLTITCPPQPPTTGEALYVFYTANGNDLLLYQAFGGADVMLSMPVTVSTFTKQ